MENTKTSISEANTSEINVTKLGEALTEYKRAMEVCRSKLPLTDEQLEFAWDICSVGGFGEEHEQAIRYIKWKILDKFLHTDELEGLLEDDFYAYLSHRLRHRCIESCYLEEDEEYDIGPSFYIKIPHTNGEYEEYIVEFSYEDREMSIKEVLPDIGRFCMTTDLSCGVIIPDYQRKTIKKIEEVLRKMIEEKRS